MVDYQITTPNTKKYRASKKRSPVPKSTDDELVPSLKITKPRTKIILGCLYLYNTISLKLLRISSSYNYHLIGTGPDYFLTRY